MFPLLLVRQTMSTTCIIRIQRQPSLLSAAASVVVSVPPLQKQQQLRSWHGTAACYRRMRTARPAAQRPAQQQRIIHRKDDNNNKNRSVADHVADVETDNSSSAFYNQQYEQRKRVFRADVLESQKQQRRRQRQQSPPRSGKSDGRSKSTNMNAKYDNKRFVDHNDVAVGSRLLQDQEQRQTPRAGGDSSYFGMMNNRNINNNNEIRRPQQQIQLPKAGGTYNKMNKPIKSAFQYPNNNDPYQQEQQYYPTMTKEEDSKNTTTNNRQQLLTGPEKHQLHQQRVFIHKKNRHQFPPEHLDVYITCQPGLENILSQELHHLGLSHHELSSGGVYLKVDDDNDDNNKKIITVQTIETCHLFLGSASNIYLRCVKNMKARALGELRRKVTNMPWKEILKIDNKNEPLHIKVKVKSSKSRLLHTTAIRDSVLGGIYLSMGSEDRTKIEKEQRKSNNKNGEVEEAVDNDDDPPLKLMVQFYNDEAQIFIDTSATPLHQRGYRSGETATKAPLRPDLAYAMLYSAGWLPRYPAFQQNNNNSSSTAADADVTTNNYKALIDPFCGSGTIAIEAAAMAYGLPPGRLRPAPFKGTTLYSPNRWRAKFRRALRESEFYDDDNNDPILITASDRDKGAATSTLLNAKTARVSDHIEVQNCAFSAHPWFENELETAEPSAGRGKILLAANLPFGKRLKAPLHKRADTRPFYQTLAAKIRGLSGRMDAIFLVNDRVALRKGGFAQEFVPSLKTKHGGIKVTGMLLKTSNDDTSIPETKKSGNDSKTTSDQEKEFVA